jgi:hypothetical protein
MNFNASRLLRDENGRVAIFKHLRPGRPSVELYTLGCEWIAFSLGTSLGVPVAPVYLESYSGIAGALSPQIPDSMNWQAFQEQGHKPREIVNHEVLPLCVVFDIWIANCDRWPRNLLIQSASPGISVGSATTLKFWLIDHGVSLLWPPVKFGLKDDGSDLAKAVIDSGTTQAEQAIRRRIVQSKITEGYWASLRDASEDDRQALYSRVREISDSTIEKAVRQVPGAYMPQPLLDLTMQQIKARRDRVDELSERLLCTI